MADGKRLRRETFFQILLDAHDCLGLAGDGRSRPQWVGEPIRIKNESRDILMVLDISTSMLERDFAFQGQAIDRLTAVKLVAGDFIKKRANDRIGLILFGTRAYLQAPLTFDHQSVNKILWEMDAGMAGKLYCNRERFGTGPEKPERCAESGQ